MFFSSSHKFQQDLRAKFSGSPPKPLDTVVHTLRRRVTATVLIEEGPRKALTEDITGDDVQNLTRTMSPGTQRRSV